MTDQQTAAQDARIAELEAQLEAVGAGGVTLVRNDDSKDADRILAEWRAYKPAPLQQGEYLPTGNPEADRVLGRLNSSDPDFDDCAEAAALIYKLVSEIKGPDGFATWKDAAVYERGLRATLETTINTASPLAYLYTDGKHPGLDFEHTPAEDLRPGFVCIPLAAAHRAARGAAQAAPANGDTASPFQARAPLSAPQIAAMYLEAMGQQHMFSMVEGAVTRFTRAVEKHHGITAAQKETP